MEAQTAAPPLQVRSPRISFADVPRRWLAGDPIATHLVNAINLLFPLGERFFVRSVHRFADELDDPQLEARVRGFAKQEGHHARSHEELFAVLEAQGFDLTRFLKVYQRVCYDWVERASPRKLRLATTAASEHFTALLARDVIENRIFDSAAPAVRKLLLWHAAEELEHKSVAFDVLQAVAPGWGWRAAGLAVGGSLLTGFWIYGFLTLRAQERELPDEPRESLRGKLGAIEPERLDEQVARLRARRGHFLRSVFLRGVADYLRPGFHPDQVDDRGHAEDALAMAGV